MDRSCAGPGRARRGVALDAGLRRGWQGPRRAAFEVHVRARPGVSPASFSRTGAGPSSGGGGRATFRFRGLSARLERAVERVIPCGRCPRETEAHSGRHPMRRGDGGPQGRPVVVGHANRRHRARERRAGVPRGPTSRRVRDARAPAPARPGPGALARDRGRRLSPHQRIAPRSIRPWSAASSPVSRRIASRLTSKPVSPDAAGVRRQPRR